MPKALKIQALASYSCLAKGAEFTAAAMRCDYDGFEETSFMQPNHIDPQLGATIKSASSTRGLAKLIELCKHVVSEIIQKEHIDFTQVPLYICLQELDRPSSFSMEDLKAELFTYILKLLGIKKLHPLSRGYLQGRAGFATALKQAQIDIYTNNHEQILIISIDSLINNASLAHYGGDMYGEGCRLLTGANSNGFIPGEAAVAILLSKPTGEENEVIISGVGTAKETATIFNEEELLRGKGLSEAIVEASNQAKLPIHETSFRVGSMSGEEYFFDEATLAQIKTLKQKIPDHPLWHPSDSIGEVGAAIGGAMVIQTYYAMLKGYAPGDNAICHISNDDALRGAFIMQHTHKKKMPKYHHEGSLEGLYFSNTIKAQLKHDAPYAWFLFTQAKDSPLFRKKDIQRLEERLESYIECFILSQRANDSLLDKLNLDDWGAVYVMAKVALVCKEDDAFTKAVEAVHTRQQAKELSDALVHEAYTVIKEKLATLLVHTNLWVRVSAIDTLKQLKITMDPTLLQAVLEEENSQVQEAVLYLIAEHKLTSYAPLVETFLAHDDEALRYAATYAGCMLQVPQAYQPLQAFCFRENPYLRKALGLLYHVVEEEKIFSVLKHVGEQTLSPRIKAYNLAMAGYPEALPILIKEMERIEHARYCGEAFSFITGVDLLEQDLVFMRALTEEEENTIYQSSKTDTWTQAHEEDLPLPDVERLGLWWEKHQDQYIQGCRYLAGRVITPENLEIIKNSGTQTQRHIAELILKLKYKEKIVLHNEVFSLDAEENHDKKVDIARHTGSYQAHLPEGHPDAEKLKADPFAYKYYQKGDTFIYEGLEDFDVTLIEWRLREES